LIVQPPISIVAQVGLYNSNHSASFSSQVGSYSTSVISISQGEAAETLLMFNKGTKLNNKQNKTIFVKNFFILIFFKYIVFNVLIFTKK